MKPWAQYACTVIAPHTTTNGVIYLLPDKANVKVEQAREKEDKSTTLHIVHNYNLTISPA